MKSDQATRAEALRRLRAFQPKMGTRYAHGRNYDRGAGNHRDVSGLSPYVRRRLVTESEVIAAALEAHGAEKAEKFVQEVLWRSYFKGWLERRPSVWCAYCEGLDRDLADMDDDHNLRARVEAAENGKTGLECFDAWAEELRQTGYLHNHSRMWFASIWIFTLELPWRLGADFFYRHLLDGDPASNTCSWRWVAGLHTRGKVYQAEAWNIDKFTQGRFSPRESDLAENVEGLQDLEPSGLPDVQPLRRFESPAAGMPTALVLTEDDCCLEDFTPLKLNVVGAASLTASHLRSPRGVSKAVLDFEAGALSDAAGRLGVEATDMRAGPPSDLGEWAAQLGAEQIAMPYAPVGPLRDWMDDARLTLETHGIAVREWRRDWDALVWPHATAGYFKVKKKSTSILQEAGLM